MREVLINGVPYFEEILSYEHYPNNYITALVGIGNVKDGKFEFISPQQYTTYSIVDKPEQIALMTNEVLSPAKTDYTDLIVRTNGAITLESIWDSIDIIRART